MKETKQILRNVIPVFLLAGMFTLSFFASSAWSADHNLMQVTLQVEGMTCVSCPATIKAALKRLNDVVNVKVMVS